MKNIAERLKNDFTPRLFNSNVIEDMLKTNEVKVIIVLRNEENSKAYENFDNDFGLYLEKLPNSSMKKIVSFIFNKKLVFYGTAKNEDGTAISRCLISKNDKLAGIVLNSYALDISISKGDTPQIDECIYATYSGIIRAATILRKQEIRKDYELHKLISSYVYLLFLKILGKHITISQQQKEQLQLICAYLFYRQFLEEKHDGAIKKVQKAFVGDIIEKKNFDEYKDSLEKLIPFNSFKDFPRVVQELNIATITQQQTMMLIIKVVEKFGFYSLIGSLDGLLSVILLSKYPTDLVSRGLMVNNEIQDKIEKKMEKYINLLAFDDEFVFLSNKKEK